MHLFYSKDRHEKYKILRSFETTNYPVLVLTKSKPRVMKTNKKSRIEKLNTKTTQKELSELYLFMHLNPLLLCVLLNKELPLITGTKDYYINRKFNEYIDDIDKMEKLFGDFGLDKTGIMNLVSEVANSWEITQGMMIFMYYWNIYFFIYYNIKLKKLTNIEAKVDNYIQKSILDSMEKLEFSPDIYRSRLDEFIKIIKARNPKLLRAIKKYIELSMPKQIDFDTTTYKLIQLI